MPTILNHYEGNLRSKLEHVKSKQLLITDAPTDNNGKGESFSPTDAVAGALSACMMTIIFDWENCTTNEKHKAILKRAAITCPVALSLHPDIKQEIIFNF